MFIRPCYRKKSGKRHADWALVESYRTDRGPRQRVVAYLGQRKDTQRRGVQRAAEGQRDTLYQQLRLFGHDAQPEPEWVEVDTANVRVEKQLDFGGPWLARELIRTLELDKLFEGLMPRVVAWLPITSETTTAKPTEGERQKTVSARSSVRMVFLRCWDCRETQRCRRQRWHRGPATTRSVR
jgi:hypothetical protein